MAKTRKNRGSNLMKTMKKISNTALPAVDKGLKSVGKATKKVASVSIPIVEKGVSAVYGTMAKGFNLGVKGAKSVVSRRRRGGASRSRKNHL